MRLKRKCSALIALLLILAGCVLRFAMPGHDYLGYLLWGFYSRGCPAWGAPCWACSCAQG